MSKTYRAKHILLSDEDDALEVLERLQVGETFEELARKFSECDSSKDGGDLGEFASGVMIAEFEKALNKLEINQVSRPVQTKFGFHIIKRY